VRSAIALARAVMAAGLVWSIAAPTALADRAASDRCAVALSPAGKSLYDKAMADVLAGRSLEDALTPPARWMVITGSISAADARVAATAAAECLKQAR
jgi:hypothetical protein